MLGSPMAVFPWPNRLLQVKQTCRNPFARDWWKPLSRCSGPGKLFAAPDSHAEREGGWRLRRAWDVEQCSFRRITIMLWYDIRAYIYIYIYIHTHTRISLSLSLYIYIYIHTYTHTCIHTCVYIYIYIFIHTHTYIYDMMWYDMLWHDMTWYGMVWCYAV